MGGVIKSVYNWTRFVLGKLQPAARTPFKAAELRSICAWAEGGTNERPDETFTF